LASANTWCRSARNAAVDEGEVDAGQERDAAGPPRGRQEADRPRLGEGEVGLGHPQVALGQGALTGVRGNDRDTKASQASGNVRSPE
jgi:hypothetical protein